VTLNADSIGLVVARVLRSSSGTPSLITVSVYSIPSRKESAADGLILSSHSTACRGAEPRDQLIAHNGCRIFHGVHPQEALLQE
jgi:hypothetical protein